MKQWHASSGDIGLLSVHVQVYSPLAATITYTFAVPPQPGVGRSLRFVTSGVFRCMDAVDDTGRVLFLSSSRSGNLSTYDMALPDGWPRSIVELRAYGTLGNDGEVVTAAHYSFSCTWACTGPIRVYANDREIGSGARGKVIVPPLSKNGNLRIVPSPRKDHLIGPFCWFCGVVLACSCFALWIWAPWMLGTVV